jgi:hypothetical protein
LEALAAELGWRWDVTMEFNPDRRLIAVTEIVATSDSGVLDHCSRWCNVAREIVTKDISDAVMIDLRSPE